MTETLRRFLVNESATQFQTKKLPGVEHLVVKLVSPPMESIGLVAGRNLLIWNELWFKLSSKTLSFSNLGQVPFASATKVHVDVKGVPGENNLSNNSYVYNVIFSLP